MEYTLLIVDNDPQMRDSIAHPLIERGYRVQTAPDGVCALELARKMQPEVVFCDLNTPRLDGLSVCEQIKADEVTRYCHFVLMVERAMSDEQRRKLAQNPDIPIVPDETLVKPCTVEELEKRARAGVRIAHTLRYFARVRPTSPVEEKSWSSWLRHELNNPLFAITGSAESALKRLERLRDGGLAEVEELLPRIERILAGAERIRETVKHLPIESACRNYLSSQELACREAFGSPV